MIAQDSHDYRIPFHIFSLIIARPLGLTIAEEDSIAYLASQSLTAPLSRVSRSAT